jgi:hypothetical protein
MLSLMKSALALCLGVCILGSVVGCDNAGDESDNNNGGSGPIVVAGTTGTPTAGTTGTPTGGTGTGTGGTGTLAEGVPLDPMNGWVDGATNSLKIQGALFPFGDPTSKMGMEPVDFAMSGTMACFKGTAAKVDMASTACTTKMFTPPATDCYGEYWGAAIGLNLNQAIDEATGKGLDPMPFDASAIKGFSFNIAGASVPGTASLRFKVENSAGEYCNPAAKPIKAGDNTIMLSDLISACWKPVAGAPTGDSAKASLIKIAWQVVTNDKATVPFDFCVSSIRAITN